MRRREKMRRFMQEHDTPVNDAAFTALSMNLKEDLPDFLADTEEHFNCPGVKIVAILSRNREDVIRCMAFRGYDPDNGYIAVSSNLEFGYSPTLRFFHPRRIASTAVSKVAEWRAQKRKEISRA